VAAVNTGNNLIYLIVAALLGFMGISGLFGKNNISGIDVVLGFPEEIYAGKGFPLKVTVINRRRLMPGFLLMVHIDKRQTYTCPFVDKKRDMAGYIDFFFERRGLNEVDGIYISSPFPFNFFTRYRPIKGQYRLCVFPSLKRCDISVLYTKDWGPKADKGLNLTGFDSDIISIRDYAHGDPLKYIHWKATAKTGRLKTKELSRLANMPAIIEFDKVMIAEEEERLSSIAYLITQLIKRDIPTGLKIRGRLYKPGASTRHRLNMLKALALYKENEQQDGQDKDRDHS
jgi:uncharacterized protein (DUF58 family)